MFWVSLSGSFKKLKLAIQFCLLLLFISTAPTMAADNDLKGDNEFQNKMESVVAEQDQKSLTGVVTDSNGEPIPGVTVIVKGTTIGTITNFDGAFSLNVPANAETLAFSFIGYTTQELSIKEQTIFNITLAEATVGVEEVVIVAYGSQKKESVVGAISQVKGEALSRTGQSTISNALTGQIPGVVTVQQSGMPGSTDAKIYVRGLSSFSGDNQPLVLVDGIERSLNNIDPSEVQNISVLKDASATAVYGVKGANGVILVTTKRGQLGRMEISGSAEISLSKPSIERNLEDSYSTLYARNQVFRNKQQWDRVVSDEILEHYRLQDMPYIYPDTDPADVMLKDFGIDYKFSVSARGGTESVKYFVSLGALHEGGMFKDDQTEYDAGYQSDRYNFRMNFDFDLTKTTNVKISSGGYLKQTDVPGDTYSYIVNYILYDAPYDSPFFYPAEFVEQYPDEKWPYEGERMAGSLVVPGEKTSYLFYNQSGSIRNSEHRIGADFSLKQDLSFITKGLSAEALISYNNQAYYNAGKVDYNADYFLFNLVGENDYEWTRYIAKTEDYETIVQPASYSASKRNGNPQKNLVYSARLDYRNTFADKHNVSALALFKRRESQGGASFPHYEEDWVGRVTYDYMSKYMLEFNAGYTGSEQFAPENRFGFFPAFALGWNVAQEKFFQEKVPYMNNFKVRYSYGESGNDNTGSNWLYISEYTNSKGYETGDITSSGAVTTVKEGEVPNMVAQWERSIKNNLGFEFGFLNSTYTLSVDLFNEKRDGILMSRRAIADWFGQSMQPQNIGATKAHGYEIEASFNKTVNNINYWVKGNFNFNENRIVARDDPKLTPDYQKLEGKPIDQPTSRYNFGYYQDADEMINYSVGNTNLQIPGTDKVLDFNGDGVVNSNDNVSMGYPTRPLYTYGLSAGMSVSNFDCSFLVQGATAVTRNFGSRNDPMSDVDKHAILYSGRSDDTWTPDNRDAEYAAWGGWNAQQKNRINASYARLKSVEVGYNFKGSFVSRIGLSSARLYLQGINLVTYAPNVTVGDPEAEPSTSADNNNYPLPKRINLGVKVSF